MAIVRLMGSVRNRKGETSAYVSPIKYFSFSVPPRLSVKNLRQRVLSPLNHLLCNLLA